MKRVSLRIHGRVQGVGYRFHARAEGERLGVVGCVRNAADGSVELVAEGMPQALQQLVTWCQRGPAGAQVTEVVVQWEAAVGGFGGFEIRR